MPEELILVYEKESGQPLYMHSIDAKEAVQLGDYTMEAPAGKELSAEEQYAASASTRGMQGTVHPELQTPEQRAATRAAAAQAAAGETPAPAPPAAPAATHTESSGARRRSE